MRKTLVFASRNTKEILRDAGTFLFGILFPLVLMVLLSAINNAVPAQAELTLFEIENLAPGIVQFGLSFIALFTATLVSKDRTTSFILRLFTSPLRPYQYILGYTLPLLPMAVVQMLVCYVGALCFGLAISADILLSVAVSIPSAVMFIGIGLLCGTWLNEKAVGGVCGAMLTNLSAWLSGTWFDLSLVGGAFEKTAGFLPFVHGVNAGRYALSGDYAQIPAELLWVTGYAVVICICAVVLFRFRMKQDK